MSYKNEMILKQNDRKKRAFIGIYKHSLSWNSLSLDLVLIFVLFKVVFLGGIIELKGQLYQALLRVSTYGLEFRIGVL